MNHLAKKLVLGIATGASLLAAVAPAQAQDWRWRRHYRDRGDAAGVALVAGIAGLAIGAAISNDRRYDYDRRFYRERGYYPTDGYWYRDNYPRYRYYETCDVRRVWDPYLERPVLIRYCN
ncbi:sulfite exporter TauE/SafE family protein [Sphingomonas sp. R1]|uniref:sulfite exporter TauE/SafE family protein n=1 Tax=Sphingomonas sp. R1 TaxID=399176 RepID=UPI0022250242|nr:sulfite exporter TauE/SafE family protein [Sphingomonas sp. R1]UYY75841.1 sulfite exporter TauE/SafE family protein [Sphingomonas sp. R1]